MENVVPVLLGVFFVMFALRLIRQFKTMEANGTATEGVIDTPDTKGRSGKAAMVQFKTTDGVLITQANSNAIMSSFLKPGDKVKVWYYEADPNVFMIKTRYTNLLLGIFALTGTALIIIGLLGIAGAF